MFIGREAELAFLQNMNTRIKLTPLKKNATFYYALFSKSGFDEKVVSEARGNGNLLLFDLPRIVNIKEA